MLQKIIFDKFGHSDKMTGIFSFRIITSVYIQECTRGLSLDFLLFFRLFWLFVARGAHGFLICVPLGDICNLDFRVLPLYVFRFDLFSTFSCCLFRYITAILLLVCAMLTTPPVPDTSSCAVSLIVWIILLDCWPSGISTSIMNFYFYLECFMVLLSFLTIIIYSRV